MAVTIGALSKKTGVHIETIRYYEKIGLTPAPDRSSGGHRLYGEAEIKRLQFIHRSRELGFSLDDIRKLLALADGVPVPCDEVRALTLQHVTHIERKIADLESLAKTLKSIAAGCHGETAPQCPIIETLSGEA